MKYLLLISLIAIACMKHETKQVKQKSYQEVEPRAHYKEFFKNEELSRIRKENKKVFLRVKKPIALVYHANINTIFHCSSVNYSDCGLTAECGEDTLYCLKNTKVEYLNRSNYGFDP